MLVDELLQKLFHSFLHEFVELLHRFMVWRVGYGVRVKLLVHLDLDSGNQKVRDAAPVAVTAEGVLALIGEVDGNTVPMPLEELAEEDRVLARTSAVINIAKTHIRSLFSGIGFKRRSNGKIAVAIEEKLSARHVGIDFLVEGIMVLLDEFAYPLFARFFPVDRLAIPCGMHQHSLFPFFVFAGDVVRSAIHIQNYARVPVGHYGNIRNRKNSVGVEIAVSEEIRLRQENILYELIGNARCSMRNGDDEREHIKNEWRKI